MRKRKGEVKKDGRDRSQEEPKAARRSQKQLEAASSAQEEPYGKKYGCCSEGGRLRGGKTRLQRRQFFGVKHTGLQLRPLFRDVRARHAVA